MVQLTLPPSTNKIWRFVPGKKNPLKSREYRVWAEANAWRVRQAPKMARGPKNRPYVLELWVGVNHRSDIDNRAKAVLDLLARMKVTPPDNWADHVLIHRAELEGTVIAAARWAEAADRVPPPTPHIAIEPRETIASRSVNGFIKRHIEAEAL